jgi:hypothetical protein
MSTTIPRGNLMRVFAVKVTFDPAAVATITTAEQDITVAGVKAGDVVIAVNKPTLTAGLGLCNARVKAADTVSVQFVNPTAGSVNAGSEEYTIVIGRPENTLGAAVPA